MADPNSLAIKLPWLERGGVYAVAHVRGGGEYGKDWHLAGKMQTKPNAFLDGIACAQYLIENGYTSPKKIAVTGTSAGGIFAGERLRNGQTCSGGLRCTPKRQEYAPAPGSVVPRVSEEFGG